MGKRALPKGWDNEAECLYFSFDFSRGRPFCQDLRKRRRKNFLKKFPSCILCVFLRASARKETRRNVPERARMRFSHFQHFPRLNSVCFRASAAFLPTAILFFRTEAQRFRRGHGVSAGRNFLPVSFLTPSDLFLFRPFLFFFPKNFLKISKLPLHQIGNF